MRPWKGRWGIYRPRALVNLAMQGKVWCFGGGAEGDQRLRKPDTDLHAP